MCISKRINRLLAYYTNSTTKKSLQLTSVYQIDAKSVKIKSKCRHITATNRILVHLPYPQTLGNTSGTSNNLQRQLPLLQQLLSPLSIMNPSFFQYLLSKIRTMAVLINLLFVCATMKSLCCVQRKIRFVYHYVTSDECLIVRSLMVRQKSVWISSDV